MQPFGVTVFYAIVSGIALMAIPLTTCILCILTLRRIDNLILSLNSIGLSVNGKLERLMVAREIIAHAAGITEGRNQSKQ